MIKSKKKRGFTIVELVIVIAVIGILSAILIPIFTGLINKANIAADSSLVDSINTQLKISEVQDGKNTTMYDALLDAKEAGFLVGNINARSKNTLVWDQEIDRFALLDAENQVIAGETVNANKKVKLWKIYSSVPQLDNQVYSIYYSGSASIESQNLKVGFDAGENENVEKLYYSNSNSSQEVIIRTNGGELNINAKNDNVIHYGYADSVNVVDVATSSYHENGTVKFLEVAAGRIVLEREAEVSAVHFTATGEGESAKFQNNDGKKISVDLSSVKAVNMPTFSRDAVVIEENGTYVAEVKKQSTEYIWLFGNGIKEQMVVTDTTDPIAENGTLKAGIEAGAEDGSVAEQIANPAKRNAEGQLVNDNYEVVSVENAVVEEVASKESVQIGATLFAGGTGTASNPFLIVDYDTFQHVTTLSWTYYAYESYYGAEHNRDWNYACNYADSFDTISDAYFKVKDGISSIDCKNWVPVFLDGNFDGNGVILNNLDKGLFDTVDGESSTIRSFTINANISVSGGVGAVVYNSNTLNLTIDSVDVHGIIIGASWVTPYVEFGPGPDYAWNLTIKNSVSDATLVATSGVASGFVGHPYDDVSNGSVNGKSLITIIDSAYIGNMSATGSLTGTNFKYFTINGNDNRVKTSYSDTFIDRLGFNPEGALYAVPTNAANYPVVVNDDGSKTFFCGNYGKNVVDNYIKPYSKAQLNTTAKASLPANVGDVFTITKVSGATKAVVSLLIAPNDSNNYGSYLGTYMTEEIDITAIEANSSFTSENVKYFTININSGVTSATGVSGDIFNVVNPYYGINAHNGATVQIVQFDTNGNVLNITSIKIATAHAAE